MLITKAYKNCSTSLSLIPALLCVLFLEILGGCGSEAGLLKQMQPCFKFVPRIRRNLLLSFAGNGTVVISNPSSFPIIIKRQTRSKYI